MSTYVEPGRAWSHRLEAVPSWLLAASAAAMLAASWALVYAAGGTQSALPHVFYVPIVLVAIRFGPTRGVGAAVVAALLCGPLMPLDVALAEAQPWSNWLARGGFFVVVGALAGSMTASVRNRFERELTRLLWSDLGTRPGGEAAAPALDGWTTRVRDAIEHGRFRPVFQPIYSLEDGRLLAVEALTRFDDGQPLQPPDVWFEQARRAGLGVELELATLQAAFEASEELDEDVALSFNASPQLLLDDRLLALLDRYEGRKLTVEITEHAVIDDYGEIVAARAALRERRALVAVDDAGAGFASLRHIVMLQPDVIKLDPSLTQDLGNDPVRRPLADALLQFSARTGSRVVVEGIETTSDLDAWQELGAHAAQGYLLARPGPLGFPRICGALRTDARFPGGSGVPHLDARRDAPTGSADGSRSRAVRPA